MNRILEKFVRRTPLYPTLKAIEQKRELKEWESNGQPAPPPHLIKQRAIRELAEKFNVKVLVETGTFHGAMVEAMKPYFDRIYSIELSSELFEKATKRFAADQKVTIIHGDSGIELGKLMDRIDQPSLFWLDGHYSAGETAKGEKDTPIYEELTHLFNCPQKGHVIMIDDARCFGKEADYPSMDALSEFIRTHEPNVTIEIENDSIRILPCRALDESRPST